MEYPDCLGGEGGIRTPGELPHNCFQDSRHKPLGHLSRGRQRLVSHQPIFYHISAGAAGACLSRQSDACRAASGLPGL